jgi:hypothetical protein
MLTISWTIILYLLFQSKKLFEYGGNSLGAIAILNNPVYDIDVSMTCGASPVADSGISRIVQNCNGT